MEHRETILSALHGLYAITDDSLMPDEQLFSKAEAALQGGCKILQYRSKQSRSKQNKVEKQAQGLRELCQQYDCLFIVNDDLALALKVGADGIHIGQDDLSLQEVRQQIEEASGEVGREWIIGVSCYNDLERAIQAQEQGASYVAFGRFFPSQTKPKARLANPNVLREAKHVLHIPIVAIGGITRDNAESLIAQGADMVAVVNDVFAAKDAASVKQRAEGFSLLFKP